MDNKPALACASPFKAKFKKRGKHTVTVVATDVAGNVDATSGVVHVEDQEEEEASRPRIPRS